jgi:hypothetical protein
MGYKYAAGNYEVLRDHEKPKVEKKKRGFCTMETFFKRETERILP